MIVRAVVFGVPARVAALLVVARPDVVRYLKIKEL
jgi:hypothetical protein